MEVTLFTGWRERALGCRYMRTILVLCVLALFLSMYLYVFPVHAADSSLTEILNTLGYTNVASSTVETFPPGRYNITLYAEFTEYLNSNVLSIYQVGTNNFATILLASEGVNGYVSPPLTKTFEVDYQFGLSLSRSDDPPFRYFTETSRNPSWIKYVMIDVNLNVPSMFLIGFEDRTYFEDMTYDDMVLSLQLQYYLKVISSYDTPSGGGWYGNGTNAFASLTTGTVDHGNGTRRVFTQWSGDSSGTDFSKSNPILMNQNKTAIANWKTQYYLTVGTVPSGLAVIPGQDWYDENQKVTLTAPVVSGYNFAYWDVDGVPQTTGLNPLTVNMNGPHSATAHYTKTFTLTIITTSGGSTTPPPGAYTFNVNATVQVTAVANAKYLFDHWELDGAKVGSANPYTVLMNSDHTINATFVILSPPQPVGGYSYSVRAVESPKPLTLFLPFVAVSAVVITAISRRRKRSKK
jgi:hypothetical protein